MKRTYTDAEKTAALALYKTDGPTQVERKLGIPKETVMTWARKTNTHTVRTEKTRAAVEARMADFAVQRADLRERFAAEAKFALESARNPGERVSGNGTLVRLSHPDARDHQSWMTSAGIATQRALELWRADSDDGVSDAKSLLTDLGRALGIGRPVDN